MTFSARVVAEHWSKSPDTAPLTSVLEPVTRSRNRNRLPGVGTGTGYQESEPESNLLKIYQMKL